MNSSDIPLIAISCPLCGSPSARQVIVLKDYYCGLPGEFRLDECRSCRHVFLNPRPGLEHIPDCYPADYAQHVPVSSDGGSGDPTFRPWYARPPIRWIPGLRRLYGFLTTDFSQLIPPLPAHGGDALEIGCGRGDFVGRLQAAGWTAEGVEPSAYAVEIAHSRGLPVRQGLAEEIAKPDGSLDAVFAWMVVEHLIDPAGIMQQIHRWLRPGGEFLFSVPNYGSFEKSLLGKYWLGYDAPRHLHHFRPRRLRQLLHEQGFRDVRIIHQRNLGTYYRSWGAWFRHERPTSPWGPKLEDWGTNSPPLPLYLAMSPVGIALAMVRQGGRLTVRAQKPASPNSSQSKSQRDMT